MTVACGHCKRKHNNSDEVRACSQGVLQHFLAEQLVAAADQDVFDKLPTPLDAQYNTTQENRDEEARQVVGKLFRPPQIRPLSEVPASAPQAAIDITEGMWKLGTRIIKIQVAVHGSGKLYGKELIVEAQDLGIDGGVVHNHTWDVIKGAVRMLREQGGRKMTLEEAEEFGALYGFCCRCGRTLTNEGSIEAGIGPICAGKFAS